MTDRVPAPCAASGCASTTMREGGRCFLHRREKWFEGFPNGEPYRSLPYGEGGDDSEWAKGGRLHRLDGPAREVRDADGCLLFAW